MQGWKWNKTREINRIRQDLHVLRNRYDRIKEIESLLGRRLTVREIHRLRHLISQLEKYQKEYREKMQVSLRKFRMGDKKVCPICLEHITENEIASGDVIGCTFSNAAKDEQERYFNDKGIKNPNDRSAIIKFFGNCCSKAKKVPTTCGEHYHINCIRGWKKDTCPTCRRPVSAVTRKKIDPKKTDGDATSLNRNPRFDEDPTSRTSGPTLNKLLKAGFITLAAAAGGYATTAAAKNIIAAGRAHRAEAQLGGYYLMNEFSPGSFTMCEPSSVDDKNIYKPFYRNLPSCPSGKDRGGFPLTHHHEPWLVGSDGMVYYTSVNDAYGDALGPNSDDPNSPDICLDGVCLRRKF